MEIIDTNVPCSQTSTQFVMARIGRNDLVQMNPTWLLFLLCKLAPVVVWCKLVFPSRWPSGTLGKIVAMSLVLTASSVLRVTTTISVLHTIHHKTYQLRVDTLDGTMEPSNLGCIIV